MEVIIGVPIDGLPVMGYTKMTDWSDLCYDMLGHRPLRKEVGNNKNTGVIEGSRVKGKWLEDRFSNPLLADATEELVQ